MKTKNSFVTVCCFSMAIIAMLFHISSHVQADSRAADYQASNSFMIGNNGSGGGSFDTCTATDLHFSVQVADTSKEWFVSWVITTSPNLVDIGGQQNITPYYADNPGPYKLDVSYTGITVVHSSYVTVNISGSLNTETILPCANNLIILDDRWTYNDGDTAARAGPDNGFDFPVAVYTGPTHSAVYNYYNYDSNVTITLNDLAFYQDSVWIEPDSQWSPSFLTDPFHQEPGSFVLQPGDSISIALSDLPNLPNSYIYVAGEMGYQMPDFDYHTVGFRHGHEELRQGGGPIPTLTEWGMIIFCALLFGWMAWVIVRRRKRVTVGI